MSHPQESSDVARGTFAPVETISTEPKRQPLYSEDAERAVLAAMLLDPKAALQVGAMLTGDEFYRGGHRAVFSAMQALRRADITIDPLTLPYQLEADGALAAAGGKEFIGGLLDEVPTAANAEHWVRIIQDFAMRRGLLKLANELAYGAKDTGVPLQETLDHGSQALLRHSAGVGEEGFRMIKQEVWDAIGAIERRRAGTEVPGFRTGWPELDDRLHGGIEPGSLVVIVGVPSSGKTCLVVNLLMNRSLDTNEPTAMVSAEMKARSLIESALSAHADVARQHIKTGILDADELSRLAKAASTLAASPIALDDTVMPDVEAVVNRCILWKAQYPKLSAIGVDFIQLLQLRDKERGELHETTIRRIAYALKGLALRLNVVVFALAQPNDKQIEDRPDKRPQLRDIQGSSGIRQAADVIMLLYREQLYNAGANNDFEVNIAKNKFGPTGVATLLWEGSVVRVASPRRRQMELAEQAEKRRPLELIPGGQA